MALLRDIIYLAGLGISSPIWGYRLLVTGKWRTDWPGRFGHTPDLPTAKSSDPNHPNHRLLINAVSVGETNLIRPMVAYLNQHHPQIDLVISVTTDTGYKRATDLYAKNHTVVRYPIDFSRSVKRFLNAIKPDAVATVELEIWPNFTDECQRRHIPVCVINGRLSDRSFRGYQKIRPLVSPMFKKLTFALVQTDAYAERFRAMGVRDVRVTDTMKWDAAQTDPDAVIGADDLAQAIGIDRSKPLIVAGSTGPGEAQMLIDGLADLPPGTQLIIAPRKPEWFDQTARAHPDIVRRTSGQPGHGPVYLLDTIGELQSAYSLADVAIVGRSFLGLYGSDVMEPAGLGKPVIIGPHHDDFQDTVDTMRNADGLIITDRPMESARWLLDNPVDADRIAQHGRDVILSRQGSSQRQTKMIVELLQAKPQARP